MGLMGVDIAVSMICFWGKDIALYLCFENEYVHFIWGIIFNKFVFIWFCLVEDIGSFEVLTISVIMETMVLILSGQLPSKECFLIGSIMGL